MYSNFLWVFSNIMESVLSYLKVSHSEEEERKKEKVGVRICWINQQIKNYVMYSND